MSYSNGKLPEDTFSHEKVIEIVKGLPGVGFKLTDDGDYDMQNKKLRNLALPQTNDDASTKSYVDSEVSKTLKLDGSNAMTGALNMDNRRVENIAPARHGHSDAVSSLHMHIFYFYLNTNDGKIEARNPIDMKNQRILGVKDPILHSDATNKFYVDNFMTQKADKSDLNNYLKRDGSVSVTGDFDFGNHKITNVANPTLNQNDAIPYKFYTDNYMEVNAAGDLNCKGSKIFNVGSYTNDDQLMNGITANSRYIRKDQGDFNLSGLRLYNVGSYTNNDQLINGLTTEIRYLRKDGSEINMNNKRVINVANPTGNTDAVNKQYLELHTRDMSDCLKRDGSISVTGDFDFGDNKITHVKTGTSSQDAVNYSQLISKTAEYLPLTGAIMQGDIEMNSYTILGIRDENRDNAVVSHKFVKDELNKKPNTNQVVLINGSNTMTGNLNMNNQRITNLGRATHNQDAITLKQVNDAFSTISTQNN